MCVKSLSILLCIFLFLQLIRNFVLLAVFFYKTNFFLFTLNFYYIFLYNFFLLLKFIRSTNDSFRKRPTAAKATHVRISPGIDFHFVLSHTIFSHSSSLGEKSQSAHTFFFTTNSKRKHPFVFN